MQILLIMLIVIFLAFSVLLLALAKQSPREKQTEVSYQSDPSCDPDGNTASKAGYPEHLQGNRLRAEAASWCISACKRRSIPEQDEKSSSGGSSWTRHHQSQHVRDLSVSEGQKDPGNRRRRFYRKRALPSDRRS